MSTTSRTALAFLAGLIDINDVSEKAQVLIEIESDDMRYLTDDLKAARYNQLRREVERTFN